MKYIQVAVLGGALTIMACKVGREKRKQDGLARKAAYYEEKLDQLLYISDDATIERFQHEYLSVDEAFISIVENLKESA